MGSSKSKQSVLSYEDAEKRLPEKELNRLKRAFSQLAPKGTLNLEKFYSEVFGGFLPFSMCEVVFNALKISGSSNVINFKELLIGIIILTGGSYEEKCRFIYNLYCNESGTGIEYSTLRGATDNYSDPNDLQVAFQYLDENSVLSYDKFIMWIEECPKFNEMTYWLLLLGGPESILVDNRVPQDLYKLVAGVTHLEEIEIVELEKTFKRLVSDFPQKVLDIQGFCQLVSPPIPESVVKNLFSNLDENNDGNIDLKELACGISACTRGPTIERKKFCCKIFDNNKDGRLGSDDIESIFDICYEIKKEEENPSLSCNLKTDKTEAISCEDVLSLILSSSEMTNNKSISIDDFLIWMNDYDFIEPLLDLLNQICTVIFNVKPQIVSDEELIIMKWLKREEKLKIVGHNELYLISRGWLKQWLGYTRSTTKENSPKSVSKDSISGSKFPSSKSLNNVLPLSRRHQYNLSKGGKSPMRVKSNDEILGRYTLHTSINGGDCSPDKLYPDFSSRSDFGSFTGSNNSISSFSSNSSFQDVCISSKLVPINNHCLLNTRLIPINPNIVVYSDDGGIVDITLKLGQDFDILPPVVWNCFKTWYGGGPALPRPIWIHDKQNELKNQKFDENFISLNRNQTVLNIELNLLTLFIMRHASPTDSSSGNVISALNKLDFSAISIATESVFTTSNSNNPGVSVRNVSTPRRQIRGHASFSRRTTLNKLIEFLSFKLKINKEEMRIWKVIEENNLLLLEDEETILQDLNLQNFDKILVEQRNIDLTWPEELIQLAKIRSLQNKKASSFKGVTGLSNIGNTCFFNSALQCTSNTNILTDYFIRDIHLCELNRTNAQGCQGMVALRYAELVKDIWAGSTNLIVPLKLKMTIDRYVHQFSGNQQHDAQEFLSALLDSLHEDLNRVKEKPSYKELKDSDGRSDEEVANEAWQSHVESNNSIVVDLFHGLLKSNVCCDICKNNSVRFDAYSMLSLPIPMQTSREIDILVFLQDCPVPRKHCVVVDSTEIYSSFIREELSRQLSIKPQSILLTLIEEDKIKKFINSQDKILISQMIYAYIMDDDSVNLTNSSDRNFLENIIFVVYHRKMIQRENYFMANSKLVPEVFSYPVVFTFKQNKMASLTNMNIYEKVLSSINGRNGIKSFFPDSLNTSKSLHQTSNHAVDCDSVNNIQPFKLSRIMSTGRQCNQCHWSRFCHGCTLDCSTDIYQTSTSELNLQYLALDWNPASLHLRFNIENEKPFIYHTDYKDIKSMNNQPMDLLKCIEIFTTEETLGKDTLYQCIKCKKPQPAHKKLDLWTLPQVLIIHLKRFQFVDNKWQKSYKIVHYPIRNLDLHNFIQISPSKNLSIEKGEDQLNKAENNDSFYNLYAVNCHLGNLQMGHYITYAKNKETDKWYMYNDSICKEVDEKEVNTSSAYLLFYERANVDFEKVLEELIEEKMPIVEAAGLISDEVDTDIKRYCIVQ